MEGKKTQGRRKIEMKMIGDEDSRRITFSKRRGGLFKKAIELSTLCGIQIAIIAFSIGGKAFSFGHPNVETIVKRFVEGNQQTVEASMASDREARVRNLRQELDNKQEELEFKKKQVKTLMQKLEKSPMLDFEEFVEKLQVHDLKALKGIIADLKKDAIEKLNHLKSSIDHEQPEISMPLNVANAGTSDVAKVTIHDRDGSPIPPDWLKL